jgi:hypothetical protein
MPDLAEARERIIALLAEFTFHVDRGEPIGHLFQEKAVYYTPRGETRGRDAIATLFSLMSASRTATGHITRHSTSDVHVRRLSSMRFEVHSLLTGFALETPTSKSGSLFVGDHVDIVEVESRGDYRFVQRTLEPKLQFSLPNNNGVAS